jgi:hypothetical protein
MCSAGHHVHQSDAVLGTVNPRRVRSVRSARAFRAAWRALTVPPLRVRHGVYVMAEIHLAGGKSQDGAA